MKKVSQQFPFRTATNFNFWGGGILPKTSPEGTTIGGIGLRITDRYGAEIWRILGEKQALCVGQ